MAAAAKIDCDHQGLQIRFAIQLGVLVEVADFADVGEAQRACTLVFRGVQVLGLGLPEMLIQRLVVFSTALGHYIFGLRNDAFTTGVIGGAEAWLGQVLAVYRYGSQKALDVGQDIHGHLAPVLYIGHIPL
ncbi:hypothetical protein D3C76_1314270 [compost metagenome]